MQAFLPGTVVIFQHGHRKVISAGMAAVIMQ
jgi:hypothetical protein